MVKLLERPRHVPGHGEMDLTLDVVPIESDADVAFALPIRGYLVVLLQYLLEVPSVFFTDVFDTKVVDD